MSDPSDNDPSEAVTPTNGHSLPTTEDRLLSLEHYKADRAEVSQLRRDLERTFRVILELQVESRNQHRAVVDKLDALNRKVDTLSEPTVISNKL